MRNNRPWTQQELDEYGKEYYRILQDRVQKHRRESNNRRYGQWDIPKVAAACASRIAPFDKERGHNCENLWNPHPTLHASYPSVKNEQNPPQYPGELHYIDMFFKYQGKDIHVMTDGNQFPEQLDDIDRNRDIQSFVAKLTEILW